MSLVNIINLKKTVIEIRKVVLMTSGSMSPTSSKETYCAFNGFIPSLPWAWVTSRRFGRSRYHGRDPRFPSDQPLAHYGKTISEADSRKYPKTH